MSAATFPRVLNALLIKPAGPDCNLACGYCFYLEKKTLFPETTAHRMNDAVLEATVRQMCTAGASHLSFGWQGGEPTLMGLPFFERAVHFQTLYGAGRTVGNSLQTNGLLLDAKWARFLSKYNFLVGISLDGPQHVHDRYRTDRAGGGTWARVTDVARRLMEQGVSVNALSVVTDYAARFPQEIYSFLKESGLTYQQFIPSAPDGVGGGNDDPSVSAEAFGKFLVAVFDLWRGDFREGMPTVSNRFFESLLNRMLGAVSSDCTLLDTCGVYLTVEHNGDVFPCDFYVSNEHRLGNVLTDTLRDLFQSDTVRRFGAAKAALPEACRQCEHLDLCKGACPKERPDGGAAPSRLCEAYRIFFAHARPHLQQMAAAIRRQSEKRERAAEIRRAHPHTGRNEPCPCGSGKKFKACCLRDS